MTPEFGFPGSPAARQGVRPQAAAPSKGAALERTTAPQGVGSIVTSIRQDKTVPPPGLIGSACEFIYSAAPHPNMDIALAGAIALMAGVCGKAYNTYTNAGLNQYILLLASTGMGKEAAASGIGKLLASVAKTVPAAGDFKGPALVSSAGLLKWLDKTPSVVSIIGEFGYKLKAISSPRANPNDEMLKATLLDLYGKSGAGSIVDPMAYSDRDKHTGVIAAPSLTILGESVPGVVYEALNDSVVLSGLLPRFMLIEAKGERSPLQEAPALTPAPELTQALAGLCAAALTLNRGNNVHVVPADDQARAKFREFGQWVTDQINAHSSEIHRELWNRAHLKALKLATLCAVGINPHAPVVTINETMWATNMVVGQVLPLLAKFDAGEVGKPVTDEDKQIAEVISAVAEFANVPFEKVQGYGVNAEMHKSGVVTKSFLQRYLSRRAAFRNDRMGAGFALERAIKLLLESDELREVPKAQMIQSFGAGPRAYVIANPTRFLRTT